jgi:hypothetical protein
MSISELLSPIYTNEELKRFKLEEKAVKVLNRFIEQSGKFISLSAARQNYRHITSQDIFIIVSELERIGYIIGRLERGRIVYKFNNSAERTAVSVPLTQIEYNQKRFEERLARKIERAAKTIERYKNLGSLVEVVDTKEQKIEEDREVERQMVKGNMPEREYTPTFLSVKTALELHEAKECDPKTCRICKLEQDKEIGFE